MFTVSLDIKHNFRRLLAVTTALSIMMPVLPANAQDATDASSTAAPPARVGEIASLTGSVSYNGAGSSNQWVAATPNYPISSGDSLFTQDNAQATLAVDSSRATLGGNTELQITSLDQNTLSATESQGEAFFSINYLQPGQSFAITTPRGMVTISQNGNYDIAAGDSTNPTVVNVFAGEATVTDPGATLQVQAGQAGVLSGTDQTVAQLGQAQRDPFVDQILAQIAPPPPSYAPPVVSQMTGVSQLGNYGSWSQSTQYGAVWYPQVSSDWAPYRQGHWAYVAPWGYTWVESEPWGFAPFHYGRWIDDGNRWGWVPAPAYAGGGYGASYQPVYAPAVVSFFGAGVALGAGVAIGLTIGALNRGNVGWVPLAPEEPYYPYYRASPSYIQRINRENVRNTNIINVRNTTINNTKIINNYYGGLANRRGATYAPAEALSRGDQMSRYGHPVSQAMLASARPVGPQGFHPAAGSNAHDAVLALPPPQVQHRVVAAPRLTDFGQRRKLPPAVLSHQPAPQLIPQKSGFKQPLGAGLATPGLNAPHQPIAPNAPRMPQAPNAPHAPPVPHPGFATMPGYHAPPPPPNGGQRLNPPNGGQRLNPPNGGQRLNPPNGGQRLNPPNGGQHVASPGFGSQHIGVPQNSMHPGAPALPLHPAGLPPVHSGNVPAFHPPAPPARPEQPAYHPPVQAYHPPAPAYHPPVQQFHSPAAPAYHPPVQQFHPPAPPAFHPPVQQFHPPEAPAFQPPAAPQPHPGQHPDHPNQQHP